MTVLLKVSNLKKYFTIDAQVSDGGQSATVKAVDGISFSIEEGKTFALVGESGSGKSTVAYTVAGMYRPTLGTMEFRGVSLFEGKRKRPFHLRRAIQLVFQDPGSSLNPKQSVRQILDLPLRLHKPQVNRLAETLRLLGLVDLPADFIHKFPDMLSGGEKQIVAITRALATDPSLIILDEPTSALDVSMQAKVITLLIRLQREFNLTYLFITHDLSMVRNVASRVAIMYLGKICEIADTAEFFTRPRHPYTQMLISSIPVVSEEEERAKPAKVPSTGEIPSPVNIPSGCSFHSRCPYAMKICEEIDPEFSPVDAEHVVRCHLCSQPSSAGE